MNIYQNDMTNLPKVPSDGCLFMSLFDCVAEANDVEPSKQEIENIYNIANERGFIGLESDKYSSGAYVWDHEAILNTTHGIFSIDRREWTYLAAIYSPFEHNRGKNDYIPHKDYISRTTHMIIQIQTIFGGHFRRFDYDPYRKGTTARYIKSIRYYELA